MYYIFYYDYCMYSQDALRLAKSMKVKHSKMNMEKLGGKDNVIRMLKEKGLMKKNNKHKTAPIIFKDDEFIGGYTEFKKILQKGK